MPTQATLTARTRENWNEHSRFRRVMYNRIKCSVI